MRSVIFVVAAASALAGCATANVTSKTDVVASSRVKTVDGEYIVKDNESTKQALLYAGTPMTMVTDLAFRQASEAYVSGKRCTLTGSGMYVSEAKIYEARYKCP